MYDAKSACMDVEAVFHMASPSPERVTDFQLFFDVNVTGTQNVIDACVACGIKMLVFTSSASVVFDGNVDIRNGNERDLKYPDAPMDYYTQTKAWAEELVLKADKKGGLRTCALRPSGLFGPGDPLFVPTLVKNAAAGKLKFYIGDGKNKMDFTYITNVAHSHICAYRALKRAPKNQEDEKHPGGKAYFISNGEPRLFWEFCGDVVEALGYERPTIGLPFFVIYPLAVLVAGVVKLLEPVKKIDSVFTPSRIKIATRNRYFDNSRARSLLGYAPQVTLDEGLKRTLVAYDHLRKEPSKGSEKDVGSCAVKKLLGNKAVASLLLWESLGRSLMFLLTVLFALRLISRASPIALVSYFGCAVAVSGLVFRVVPEVLKR